MAQSPDLNPIEHVWHQLNLKLSYYERTAKNTDELWERVEKAWNGFNKELCQSSINPSTVNTSLQVSPSEVQKPSRYPQKTSLLNTKKNSNNTKKNSNNINNKQAPASPEPSSATKRTLADRSPPIFPADLARQPSGKPKVDMDINYITNPTLMGQPDLNFGPTTTPHQPVLSITGPMDFGVPHGTPDWFQPIMAVVNIVIFYMISVVLK
ncbi:hypothetical protein G6F60_013311 [Rhizopus arrhizus]|nr:hypothetical protein G6F60_013311 [Rhizopus arrhizus]